MATPTLANSFSPVLADLIAATTILDTARVSISDGPMKPWSFLNDASKYLKKQIDDAVAPIFSEEPYDGKLIDNLTELVEKVEQPKPPQSEKNPDPLTIALNGFPDVNTYYAEREGY